MTVIKSRWKQKSTGNIIHPETEVDQISDITQAAIRLLLKSATTAKAREAIEAAASAHSHQFSDLSGAAAASHTHSTGDITSFASNVVAAIGTQTLYSLGVRYSITTNGYICFGDLFGGLILQWANNPTFDTNYKFTFEFPLRFPHAVCGVAGLVMNTGTDSTISCVHSIGSFTAEFQGYVFRRSSTSSGVTLSKQSSSNVNVIAIGY